MEFDVELDAHHLERLGAVAPLTAVTELIWNALDADATEIKVEFARNDLDGIDEIRVIDDGHGMTPEQALDGFKTLGLSWKLQSRLSPTGRPLHGRDGRGRYLAAGLGDITWKSVAIDPADANRRQALTITLTNLKHVEMSDPVPTDDATGTRVVINGFIKEPAGLNGERPIESLTGTFGLHLQNNNAHLTYDRTEIDPDAIQDHRAEYPIPVEGADDALLVVVEWKRRVDRALYFCDELGTPLHDEQPRIQAPGFEFTAYLQWTGFRDDKGLALINLDSGESGQLVEAARNRLREHFKERSDERTRQVITDWQEENVYPFEGEPQNKVEEAARDVFDVVAVTAASAVNSSEAKQGRRLSLRLLREALEHAPGSLHRVLTEVLDLKEERLEELSALLDKTPLAALIETSKQITDRLEFLGGLEELVLGDESKHVKERSQLHRVLTSETWVFGEEYAIAGDDNSLTTVLKKHLAILGREELAEDVSAEVLDANGSRAIVDLMLARSLSQNRNRREHLVVELKAPKVTIGDVEAAQIKRYADTVVEEARFDVEEVEWDFIIVSSKVKGMVDKERKDRKTPYGQISNPGDIRISVLT